MDTDRTTGTYPLDELGDFKVAESDIDPRGWDVMSSDRQKIGSVKDLMVDVEAMKVRYIVFDLDEDQTGSAERLVLMPVGHARLDDDDDVVMVNDTAASIREMPAYELGGRMDRDQEDAILGRRGPATAAGVDVGYYQRPEFDSQKFYGSRFLGDSNARPSESEKGMGDRIADSVDDMKDRVDGNPRSRPGRDETDRAER